MDERPVYRATAGAEVYDRIGQLPVTVPLDNVRSLYNVGSFFRTADAVRVQRILLAGITADPGDRRIAKTALGAERSVPCARVEDVPGEIDVLRANGYEVVAVETSLRAVDLFDWRPAFPVCAIFGHETEGVSAPVLARCDIHVRIPTLGLKQSLNVATAGGVVLYELLRKYRVLAGIMEP